MSPGINITLSWVNDKLTFYVCFAITIFSHNKNCLFLTMCFYKSNIRFVTNIGIWPLPVQSCSIQEKNIRAQKYNGHT